MSTTTTSRLRVSDTEREHVAQILRAATGAGLLSLDEVEERLAVCYAALAGVLAALLAVAWTLSDAEFFWPVWPIAFLVFGLVRHLRRGHQGTPA